MNTLEVTADQVITLNNYPLHCEQSLQAYVDKTAQGAFIPYVPVMDKRIVLPSFSESLRAVFATFERTHPQAQYFMLDGSHRTSALSAQDKHIIVVVYERDEDIIEAKKQVSQCSIRENDTLELSVAENCAVLAEHFTNKPYFMTVREKTEKLISDGLIPLARNAER